MPRVTQVTSGWYLIFLHFKNTLSQNENFTLFIMGFTMPEIKHLYLPMQEMKFNHV